MLTGNPELGQPLTDEQKKTLATVQEAEAKMSDPTPVAEQVYHFLSSDTPRLHYMAANSEEVAHVIIREMLDRALQLNASQTAFTLNRDALIKTLDEILAKQAAGTK